MMKTQVRWIGVATLGMVLGALATWGVAPWASAGAAEGEAETPAFQAGTTVVPWYNGWVRTRGLNEGKFTAKTRQAAYEVMFDTRTDNVIYMLPESGAISATPSKMNREFRLARIGKSFESIRFDPRNGTAWRMRNDQWSPIADAQPLASGLYDVQLLETSETTFYVLRTEGITGQSWTLVTGAGGDSWRAVPERAAAPAPAPAP